jgi:hypothetical protein
MGTGAGTCANHLLSQPVVCCRAGLTRFIYADAQLHSPRLLRQGGFETRPYMSLDPSTTLDLGCCVAYVRSLPDCAVPTTQPVWQLSDG